MTAVTDISYILALHFRSSAHIRGLLRRHHDMQCPSNTSLTSFLFLDYITIPRDCRGAKPAFYKSLVPTYVRDLAPNVQPQNTKISVEKLATHIKFGIKV